MATPRHQTVLAGKAPSTKTRRERLSKGEQDMLDKRNAKRPKPDEIPANLIYPKTPNPKRKKEIQKAFKVLRESVKKLKGVSPEELAVLQQRLASRLK